MAGCKEYAPATTDFPGGVPLKESCTNTNGSWGPIGRVNTEWYYVALYLYHGVKWGITALFAYLGYRYERKFRIGSAAYAGAYEIQATGLAIYSFLVYGYGDDLLQFASQEYAAGASFGFLYFLMIIGALMQNSLKDLEVAVDECEAAGRARARLRNTMDDLQKDIRELRAKAAEEKEELSKEKQDEQEQREQRDQIDQRTEQQIGVINMQLDSLKVAAAVAEKKVCDDSSESGCELHTQLHLSLTSLPFLAQFLVKYAEAEKQDEQTYFLHPCKAMTYLLLPMRKLDNAVLYATYSGFASAFIDRWQKRVDTLEAANVEELKGLSKDVAKIAENLMEPESFASMGGLSFMDMDIVVKNLEQVGSWSTKKKEVWIRTELKSILYEVVYTRALLA